MGRHHFTDRARLAFLTDIGHPEFGESKSLRRKTHGPRGIGVAAGMWRVLTCIDAHRAQTYKLIRGTAHSQESSLMIHEDNREANMLTFGENLVLETSPGTGSV